MLTISSNVSACFYSQIYCIQFFRISKHIRLKRIQEHVVSPSHSLTFLLPFQLFTSSPFWYMQALNSINKIAWPFPFHNNIPHIFFSEAKNNFESTETSLRPTYNINLKRNKILCTPDCTAYWSFYSSKRYKWLETSGGDCTGLSVSWDLTTLVLNLFWDKWENVVLWLDFTENSNQKFNLLAPELYI
jgi:hypothetical protein